jgi:hypothetical protein
VQASFYLTGGQEGKRHSYANMIPTPRSLSLTPYTRLRTVVSIKEKDEPHRALGWMMTLDCKSTAHYKLLLDKAQLFASAIHGIRMRRQDVPLDYNCYYDASIGYTLAATKLSLNQCKSIQSHVVCATLKKWVLTETLHVPSALDRKASVA